MGGSGFYLFVFDGGLSDVLVVWKGVVGWRLCTLVGLALLSV